MEPFTYREIGATRSGSLPDGYAEVHRRVRLGSGPEVFAAAGEAVLTWRLHRAVGVRPRADADRAAPGVRVTVRMGFLAAPCAVVWAVDSASEAGFGYGTLPGHPECGEEGFLVQLEQGEVWFTVNAFSRPDRWFTRAGGPLVPLFQKLYVRRCGQVMRRFARAASK
ncbi:DUF1990 family protein [Streptacidiphilus sp. PAMC 29251]